MNFKRPKCQNAQHVRTPQNFFLTSLRFNTQSVKTPYFQHTPKLHVKVKNILTFYFKCIITSLKFKKLIYKHLAVYFLK